MKKSEQDGPVNSGDAAGQAASGEQRQGGEFAAPLGSLRGGRLIFVSGALYRARFESRTARVGVEEGAVTIRYPRFDWRYFLRERPAEVALNASIPWDIEIRDGASKLTADLRGLDLRSFEVRGGASNVAIHRPQGVAAHVCMGGGSTNLAFDEERFGAVGGEVSLQSPNHEYASYRYDLIITGGASNVAIDTN